ncbi:MAG: RING finger protein [Janthinobacterium lividum]
MPCGHIVACTQCAVMLDRCAACRQPIVVSMRIGFDSAEREETVADTSVRFDPTVCKVCCDEPIQVVCLPCRHVSMCCNCALDDDQFCLICSEFIFAYMSVYI